MQSEYKPDPSQAQRSDRMERIPGRSIDHIQDKGTQNQTHKNKFSAGKKHLDGKAGHSEMSK